jgi:tetratricopeptide (TPR) repeat protein
MINLAIALAIAAATLLLSGFVLGGGDFNLWYGLLPAVIAAVVAYLLLMRRTLQQVEATMGRAQQELMQLQALAMTPSVNNQAKIKEHFARAIEIMKEAHRFDRWQFLIDTQINGQVGMLYYLQKEFDQAEPYLRNSFYKNWIAQAMLALTHFRRREYDKMEEVFERAVKANKKDSLLWALYAWCQFKNDKPEAAIRILARAKESVTDERINSNLLSLQNKEKMDMEGWGEQWYQFHLVLPPQARMQQMQMQQQQQQLQQRQQMAGNLGKISRRGTYR